MSAHTAAFKTPSLSHIDAKWKEPNPSASAATDGLAAWLSAWVAGLQKWLQENAAAAELARMSDHELMDIGITRSDLSRVFDPSFNQDSRARGIRR